MATDTSSSTSGGSTSTGGTSSSDGTSSNGGTSSTGSSDTGSASTSASPIDGLTTNIKQIKDTGPADLKLSTDTKNSYLKVIGDYRTVLQAQRDKMTDIQPLGSPGTLGSAIQTKSNFEVDVTGLGGIHESLDKYLAYLDDFADTVNKAADRLIQNG